MFAYLLPFAGISDLTVKSALSFGDHWITISCYGRALEKLRLSFTSETRFSLKSALKKHAYELAECRFLRVLIMYVDIIVGQVGFSVQVDTYTYVP